MGFNFSDAVVKILEESGWRPGRIATIPPTVRSLLFPAAQLVLEEFGGLHIGRSGPGTECATSDVRIEPSVTIHLLPGLNEWGRRIGTQLFPLAEVHCAGAFLVIDAEGRTYLFSDILEPYAPTFDQGLECLLLGKKVPVPELESAWGNTLPILKQLQGE